jgi:hypothetical protein
MNVASDLAEPLIIPMNIAGALVTNTTRSANARLDRLVSLIRRITARRRVHS